MKKFLLPILIFIFIFEMTVLLLLFNKSRQSTVSSLMPAVKKVETSIHKNRVQIDSLFLYHNPDQIEAAAFDEVVIIATGDVIPARSVNNAMMNRNNFIFPFEKTVSLLRSGDIVFINLESPLIDGCQQTIEGMLFCGSSRAIEGLRYAGVTVASLGNNHAGNYGSEGITKTVSLLEKNGIAVIGIDPVQSAIIIKKGKRFGFLGYNDIGANEPGIAWADTYTLTKNITELKKSVDEVIVTFHWGIEYVLVPNSRQRELGRVAIDAGADLVIGNHPHWVQGVEEYKGKLITYAHGNFIFDQMWSQETREGVVGRYIFGPEGLRRVSFYPVIIDDYSTPRFATLQESRKILGRMKESSEMIQTMK